MGQDFVVGKGNTGRRCSLGHALEHLYEFGSALFDVLFISVFALTLIFLKPTIGHPFQDPGAEYLDELLIELISHFII
jgi:hypothetical protein